MIWTRFLWNLVEANLMSAEGQYVKVRDLTIYYETFGSGEPLVLLHGGTVIVQPVQPVQGDR